jgi:hypothetical protein
MCAVVWQSRIHFMTFYSTVVAKPSAIWRARAECTDFAAGELLDCFFERRVLLPDDLVEIGRPHSGILQLMVRSPCFDCFMLANVANK